MACDNKDLLHLMECPTCMEFMDGAIEICRTGHSVCGRCRKAMKTCPFCRSVFPNVRNYHLERIASVCQLPCRYSEYGCPMFLPMAELTKHVVDCEWKPYECRLRLGDNGICLWSGPRSAIDDHCRDEHNLICLMQEDSLDIWRPGVNDAYEVQMIYAYEEKFYLTRILKDNIMYWMLHFIGVGANAKNYHLQLRFTKPKDEHPTISMETSCHGFDKPICKIIEDYHCIGIPIKCLENYRDEINNVSFHVKVIWKQF